MLKVEFLSLKKQKASRQKKLTAGLLIAGISCLILFMSAETILKQSLISLKNNEYGQGYEFNNEVKRINSLTNFIKEAGSKHTRWSEYLIELADKLPPGITLTGIQIDREFNMLKAEGLAANRSDLSGLEKNLNSSIFFQNAYVPMQNFNEKTDIKFELKANLSSFY